jgi:putative spermidine/putrescine transport system permease protein
MLARTNLQTALFEINLSDGQIAAAVSLLVLGGTVLLMVALDLLVALQERRIRPSTRSDVS